MFSSPVAVLRLDARDTLEVFVAVEDTGVVEDLQALETALAAVDAGSVTRRESACWRRASAQRFSL